MTMGTVRLPFSAPLMLLVAAAGCEQPRVQSPRLVLLDSVQLAETATLFVGQATGLASVGDGSFLVPDGRTLTVHHFGAGGERIGGFGRRGSGPGELAAPPMAVALDNDVRVLVLDGAGQLSVFAYPDAEFQSTHSTGKLWSPNQIAARSGRAYFRLIDRVRRTSIGILDLATDSLRLGGPFPAPLGSHPVFVQLAFASVAPLGSDSVALVLLTSDALHLGSLRDSAFEAIPSRGSRARVHGPTSWRKSRVIRETSVPRSTRLPCRLY